MKDYFSEALKLLTQTISFMHLDSFGGYSTVMKKEPLTQCSSLVMSRRLRSSANIIAFPVF